MTTNDKISKWTAAGLKARAYKLIGDSAFGKRLRRIKGARHAHKTIRASGRVPGQEARAAFMRNHAARKAAANMERVSQTME